MRLVAVLGLIIGFVSDGVAVPNVPPPASYRAPFPVDVTTKPPEIGKRALKNCEHAYYNNYQARKIDTLRSLEARLIQRYPQYHRATSEALIVQIEKARLDRISYFYFLERDPGQLRSDRPLAEWAPSWDLFSSGNDAKLIDEEERRLREQRLLLLGSDKAFKQRYAHWQLATRQLRRLEQADPKLGGASRIIDRALAGEGIMKQPVSAILSEGEKMAEELGCGNYFY